MPFYDLTQVGFVQADTFAAQLMEACGNFKKKQNSHRLPQPRLEILKNRISTNVLILRKESTPCTIRLLLLHTYFEEEEKQKEKDQLKRSIGYHRFCGRGVINLLLSMNMPSSDCCKHSLDPLEL
jgi:hypothetical protein